MRVFFGFVWMMMVVLFPAPDVCGDSVSGIVTMEFDLSHHKSEKNIRLWIPYPVSDRDQDITNVHIKGDFTESAIYTDSKFKTPMLYAEWDRNTMSRKLFFHFRLNALR
jgi:hypothetical protein